MENKSDVRFLNVLIQMGEALQNSGAEIYRVEDTLNRIGYAYGAEEMNVFVITSSIIITMKMVHYILHIMKDMTHIDFTF